MRYRIYSENILNRTGARLRSAAGGLYARIRNADVDDSKDFYKFVGIFKGLKKKYNDFKRDAIKLGITGYPLVSDFMSEMDVIMKNYDGIAQSYQNYRTGFTPYHIGMDTFIRHLKRLDKDFRTKVRDLLGIFQNSFEVLFKSPSSDAASDTIYGELLSNAKTSSRVSGKDFLASGTVTSEIKSLLLNVTRAYYKIVNRTLPDAMQVALEANLADDELTYFFAEFERLEGIFNYPPGLSEIAKARKNLNPRQNIIDFFYYYGKSNFSRLAIKTYRWISKKGASLIKEKFGSTSGSEQNEEENKKIVAQDNYIQALKLFHEYILISYRLLRKISNLYSERNQSDYETNTTSDE